MTLSWNEIRSRAGRFVQDWANETSETAERQSFWNDFFDVYGIKRRTVAIYERHVQKIGGDKGFIDLFWPGTLIVEHKSAGKDLDSAFLQASEYALSLPDRDRPRYVVVSDFQNLRLYDLEATEKTEKMRQCTLAEFPDNVDWFGFIAGYSKRAFADEETVNVKAAELVAELHDALLASGYTGHALKMMLVRLVFCFFADDTAILGEPSAFRNYIETKTNEDGSDVGPHLNLIFQILNTPTERRQTNLDEAFRDFPFVDGILFSESLPVASFDSGMRDLLIKCSAFDWSSISPAIFGSMFQSAMDPGERHQLGAHYTSEKNILKVISGLFLDDLCRELDEAGMNERKLKALHDKIAGMKFLDPACGCGNFLVVTYRELRKIETEILGRVFAKAMAGLKMPDVSNLSRIDVDSMFGIEIEELPALIATLALWLTDHQMNMELSKKFGQYYNRLPLKTKPTIVQANALKVDWNQVIPKSEVSYVFGNPPFVGSKLMTEEQREEIVGLFGGARGAGTLDYVTGWYVQAAKYIQGTGVGVAFVSTNSITQGEQPGILWGKLKQYGLRINFAHKTFKWSNEARGKAAVFCVIIGFSLADRKDKRLYDYEDVKGEPLEFDVERINPYLVEAPDIVVTSRSKPLCDVPEIGIGNKPIDDGNYLFTPEEKAEFLKKEPQAGPHFRRWLGSQEFINGIERWCLWLGDCPPEKLRQMPEALKRVEAVRKFRLASKSAPTRELADTPTRFHVENMPESEYLVIPEVSSERRHYIPIGYIKPEILASNLLKVVPNASLYHFGVLTSEMHMAWVRQVCGRLEARYRYSKDIVYNNFPWPDEPDEKKKAAVEAAAQAVLDTRAKYPNATLADLYDPNTMPADLLKAHHALDSAVDRCYGKKNFSSETDRLKFLFERYQSLAD